MKNKALLIVVIGLIVVATFTFLIIKYFGEKKADNISNTTINQETGAEQSETAVPLNADLFK